VAKKLSERENRFKAAEPKAAEPATAETTAEATA